MRADRVPKVHEPGSLGEHLCLCIYLPQHSVLTSAASATVSSPFGDQTPRATQEDGTLLHGALAHQDDSPPRDFELIDGTLAVVVVDKVLVAHPDALMVHGEALG